MLQMLHLDLINLNFRVISHNLKHDEWICGLYDIMTDKYMCFNVNLFLLILLFLVYRNCLVEFLLFVAFFSSLPTGVKIIWGFAPKLVAISMGWMIRENMMSARAKAIMNTSMGLSFLLRNMRTKMTSRLRMQLTATTRQLFFATKETT